MNIKNLLLPMILVLLFAPMALAQRVKIEPDQQYLLLATTKTKTMQKELEEVSAKGFRILLASATKTEMVLFLERVAAPPDVYKYQLLATFSEKTMEKELNEAAAKGFRLLPQTLMHKEGWTIFQNESVAILEQQPKSNKRYEYKVLATALTGKLQKSVSEATASGFKLLAMVSSDGTNRVIMEKETVVEL